MLMYRSLILRLELWKSVCAHRPPQTMAVAVCIVFLRHRHLLYSHQSLSLEPDNDTVTYTHNTTGDARLQSVLNRLSYSLQPSTVPVPIRISAQSASTSLCYHVQRYYLLFGRIISHLEVSRQPGTVVIPAASALRSL